MADVERRPPKQRLRRHKDGKKMLKKNAQGILQYNVSIVSARYDEEGHLWMYTLNDWQGQRIDGETKETMLEPVGERMERSTSEDNNGPDPFKWQPSFDMVDEPSYSDNKMLDRQSIADSGCYTGTQAESDASSLAGLINFPNAARDEFVAFFAKSMHEHMGPWAEVAIRTCRMDDLYKALTRLLNEYAMALKADAKTGLQEQSRLAIRRYRFQIALTFIEDFGPQANDNGDLYYLVSLMKKLVMLKRSNAALPSRSTFEEEWFPYDEGLSDDEETQDIPVEFSLVKSFLTSSPAFVIFRGDLQEQIYYSTGGMMQTIRKAVLDNIDITSPTVDAELIVCGWEIRELLKDQYESCQSLAQTLLITGTAKQAFAVPCVKYMQDTWPASGQSTLAALEIAVAEGVYECEQPTSLIKSIELSSETYGEAGNSATIAIHGSPTDVVEVAQQFSLLAAYFRPPCHQVLCKSEASITHIEGSSFRLDLLDLQPVLETESSCWHPLFAGSVIALGFPIPPRCKQVGIEIPYSLMTTFARVLYPVEFDGGIILKGFSTMLVPTSCTSDTIQWHFISNEGHKRLPTTSVKDRITEWSKIKDFGGMCEKRAILGFCGRVKLLLGTRDADYECVGYSTYAKRIGRKLEIAGGTASFAATIHGLPGPTFGLNLVLSRNQGLTRSLVNEDYVAMLEEMKERPLILYDVDIKKSWLVPTISVVLHMMHIWARKNPNQMHFGGKAVELPFAEASWDGGSAALKAIFEKDKSLLELHAVPNAEAYRLMDLVKRLWGNIESAIDNLEGQKPSGFRFERPRTIRAWELMDMIIAKPLSRPKEHRVKATGGGWQLLADDVITLFCSELGDIIIPDRRQQICRGWSPIPPMKDYMVASVLSLRSLSGTCGKVRAGYVRLTDELCLLESSSCSIVGGCSHGPDERCDILLEIKAIQKEWLINPLETPHSSGLPGEGAIVIGRKPLFSTLRNANPSSVPYKNRQPTNADRITTCKDEQDQPRTSLTGELSSNINSNGTRLEDGDTEMNDVGDATHSGTTQEDDSRTALSSEELDPFKCRTVTLHLQFGEKPSLADIETLCRQMNGVFERHNLGVNQVRWGGMKKSLAAQAIERFQAAGRKRSRRESISQQQVSLDDGSSKPQFVEDNLAFLTPSPSNRESPRPMETIATASTTTTPPIPNPASFLKSLDSNEASEGHIEDRGRRHKNQKLSVESRDLDEGHRNQSF